MYHCKGLVQQPKLSPIPVSLLDHVEAARVNMSSFTYFNRVNSFHSQVKRLSFDDQIMLLIVKTLRKSHDLTQYAQEV